MPVSSKKWIKSRTLIFNFVCLTLSSLEATLPILQPLLGEQSYLVIIFVVTLGNMLLRFDTNAALTK